jgi:hypothetical protein
MTGPSGVTGSIDEVRLGQEGSNDSGRSAALQRNTGCIEINRRHIRLPWVPKDYVSLANLNCIRLINTVRFFEILFVQNSRKYKCKPLFNLQ